MMNEQINNGIAADVNTTVTQYVDEFGNPIDPSLIDANGNYIGEVVTQYVDEFGNPIDPSLIDANGNYIGTGTEQSTAIDSLNNFDATMQNVTTESVASQLNNVTESLTMDTAAPVGGSEHQMDEKEFLQGMVTFDYNNVPITDIVNSIILDSINKGASDIHFDPFDEGIKIRVRIDGQLNDYSIVPLFVKKNMITRIKIIAGMNITESRVPQDGAIRTELQNKTIDLRVSCLPTNMGEKIVVRIMDYSMSASGIEALDFSENNLEKVKKMLALPNGIILVTGATGSGKSTTVYSMLQKLNVEGTNLVTVEDPIEMNIGGINQVQAQSEIGLTFASVLRSILRQDPDVIMIGEIRDDETARIAVRASITGHLVLSTIHTNNSLNTIERLTDMSVERYLLGSSLSGIISQKLSRRLCEHCKQLRPTTEYEQKVIMQALGQDVKEIYSPVGCPHCSRGYRGRIAIHEVLLVNQGIRDAITQNVTKAELRNQVYSAGGTTTMLQDGLSKVLDGKTSFEEILKLIDLEDDLGTGTQLGLDSQLQEAQMGANNNVSPETTNIVQGGPTTINSSSPINFNLSDDVLAGLKDLIASLKNNSNDDDEDEVIIKKKRKKKKIVEIIEDDEDEDIEELTETDDFEEIDETEVLEDTEEVLEELPEEVETLEENIEKKEEDKEKIETIDEVEDETFNETLEELPATDDSIANVEMLLSRIENNLDKIFSAKELLTKKNFNLRIQEIITATIPLVKDLTTIDDKYRFSDKTELEIAALLDSISLKLSMLEADESIYKNTKKRINKLLTVIPNGYEDEDVETLEDDQFTEIFDELINTQPTSTKEKSIDEILQDIESIMETVETVDLGEINDTTEDIIVSEDTSIALNTDNDIEFLEESTTEEIDLGEISTIDDIIITEEA